MRQDAIIASRCEDMSKIKSFRLLSTSYMVPAAIMKHWSHNLSDLFSDPLSHQFLWVKFHSYSFKLMEQELGVSLCRSQLSIAHLRPTDLNLLAFLFLDASVLYYLHDPSAVLCYLRHKRNPSKNTGLKTQVLHFCHQCIAVSNLPRQANCILKTC